MASWLDKTGLTYFWGKCKAAFAAKSHTHNSITVSDTRSAENPPTWGSKEVKPFFTNKNLPSGITTWASGLHVNGWTGDYNAWEIVGPSNTSDQRTQPFYVRVGRTTNGWGSWRQLYDSSNPQTTINGHSINSDVPANAVFTDTTALGSMTGTLGVGHGGTGVATLGAGVVYHSASGTGALSIATAANLVSALGTTAVNRATADANGDNIANTYFKKSELGSLFYGTCSTAAATQAKVVTCPTFTSANLVAGTVINVTFTNAQTYNGAPTLNVNSTGAKNIRRNSGNNAARYEWYTGETVQFMYDGTYWIMVNGSMATTTYYGYTKLSDSISSTDTGLAATANAVKKAYDRASAVIAPETGTVTLVYTGNGSQLETGTGVWKSGHVVTVYLQYSSTVSMTWNGNPNNNDVVASIPASFAPASAMRFPMFTTADWGTYNIGYMTIQADGKMVALSKSTTCMFGTFTYVKTN